METVIKVGIQKGYEPRQKASLIIEKVGSNPNQEIQKDSHKYGRPLKR
jgi:hypothetical protein